MVQMICLFVAFGFCTPNEPPEITGGVEKLEKAKCVSACKISAPIDSQRYHRLPITTEVSTLHACMFAPKMFSAFRWSFFGLSRAFEKIAAAMRRSIVVSDVVVSPGMPQQLQGVVFVSGFCEAKCYMASRKEA
jgi:hypothetical protein